MAFSIQGFCSPNAAAGYSSTWSCRKVKETSFRYPNLGSRSLISRKPGESSFKYPIIRKVENRLFGYRNRRCCGAMTSVVSDESDTFLWPPRASPWLSKPSPWLMLPPIFERGDNMVYQFYSLGENRVLGFKKKLGGEEEVEMENRPDDYAKIVGSSHGWLILYDEDNYDLFLSNPLTRRHIKLPPIQTLQIPDLESKPPGECLSSIILSSSSPDEDDGRAMIIYGPSRRLAFCCPGRSTEWTPLGDLTGYASCVYSSKQKLFFCCTRRDDRNFEAWELGDPLSPRMIPMVVKVDEKNYPVAYRSEEELDLKGGGDNKFLAIAEQSDQLFHVRRFVMHWMGPHGYYVEDSYYGPKMGLDDTTPYRTVDFDVHKYNPETGLLEYMDRTLDGLALFIGSNNGFALSAAEFPELKPDSIYYTAPLEWHECVGGYDVGIFDYQDRTFSPCFYPCDVQSLNRINTPKWFTPNQLIRYPFLVNNNHDHSVSCSRGATKLENEAFEDGRLEKEAMAGLFKCADCGYKCDNRTQLGVHYETKHPHLINPNESGFIG